MRGRKPNPIPLRLVGDHGLTPSKPRRHRRRIPTCPAHLSTPAKTEWKRVAPELSELRLLTMLDRGALSAYCQAYGRWVEAERKLQESPMLLKMPSGYIQQSPWLTIANKQLELMHRYITDLGLSPAGRTRLNVNATSYYADDDPDDDLD